MRFTIGIVIKVFTIITNKIVLKTDQKDQTNNYVPSENDLQRRSLIEAIKLTV